MWNIKSNCKKLLIRINWQQHSFNKKEYWSVANAMPQSMEKRTVLMEGQLLGILLTGLFFCDNNTSHQYIASHSIYTVTNCIHHRQEEFTIHQVNLSIYLNNSTSKYHFFLSVSDRKVITEAKQTQPIFSYNIVLSYQFFTL